MKKQLIRRHRCFLPQTSQPRMLIGLHFVSGVVALLMTTFLFLNASRDLTESYWSAHVAIRNVQQILLPTLAVANVVGFVLNLLLLVFYTHHITGPAYHLQQILREVAQSDLSVTVRFHKWDFLHELAEDANLALDHLRREIGSMEHIAASMARSWEQCDVSGLQPGQREELAASIQELHRRLSGFQLEKSGPAG